ncbi:ABC transporter ATP-binding protein [Puniceibacterium confluentis]|uniref:ABC transporter ATP-binding protein n=1 Tax=Puniceibacterium confluentis TaxID=1958944 RepID=UPI0011B5FBBC|nr:dipeptide ABC transporter ATP-binding protein [Puniceibacterium confluentis]
MSLLEIRNLSLSLGPTRILRDLSLDIAPGEILALTGESGSGKSMTALATMGLLPPGARTSGRIRLNGTDLLSLSEARMCDQRGNTLGMVFQEPMTALNPVQTIGQQVAETLHLTRRSDPSMTPARVQALLHETLARVGLPPDRVPPTRYPHELSGGQRQRVVIAMAIIRRPALLIADEPTTALDVTTQAQILDLLRRLVQDNAMGLMMITHDLAVVGQMADRIAVLRAGEIVEQGPTHDVFAQRRHPYTRALFDASRHRADLHPVALQSPLLQVRNVSRDYPVKRSGLFQRRRSFPALSDISFDLRRGERLGLVGESGSGKSTLTRAILGLDPVSSGTITLAGTAVRTNTPSTRRHMQAVFQDPYSSFNPRHRVSRLISEPFHLLDNAPTGAARDAAVAEVLSAVNLSPSDADKYIHAFSGGQRQRIAIARALIIRPDLILFDEAVSALDVRVRAQILDLIADLSRRYNLSYLFISHDLSVVRGITDRVMVMQAGKIVEQGPTEQVLGAPRHPYTQSLIAAAPRLPDPATGGFDAARPAV